MPTDLPTHSFPTAEAFSSFLSQNHSILPGIYLKLAKKASGIQSVSAPEAVEIALCHGWIDGRANSIDDKWWTVRYTPRRGKSIWSQKNVATVGRLIEEGKMRDSGMKCVEEAKRDGRWERAYAGPRNIEVPGDFEIVLQENMEAKRKFEGLNRRERYSVLWRVETASLNARKGRIESLVEMLSRGEVPGEEDYKKYSKPKVKTKAKIVVRTKVEKDGVKKVTLKKQSARGKSDPKKTRVVKATDNATPRIQRRPGLRSAA